MDPSRVETVKEWPVPTCYRDIQVFLGFTNFYRRFIREYARICVPLTDLLKKIKEPTAPFRMGPEALASFEVLKSRFRETPLLRHFDPQRRIKVETDGSKWAIAGILSQLFGEGKEARWHPIAFYSKKLTPVESRYDTHDIELMAIVYAFRQWGQYLRGSADTVTVRTDHNNLKYFMTKRKLTGRQARWAEGLGEFDFVIEFRPGKTNPADGPSRRPDYRESTPNRGDGGEEAETSLPTLYDKLRVAGLFHTLKDHLGGVLPGGTSWARSCEVASTPGGRRPRTGEMPGLQTNMTKSWAREYCGVIQRVGFKPAAGIAGCKQRVPRKVAIMSLSTETVYGRVTKPIRDVLTELQKTDPFSVRKITEETTKRSRTGGRGPWSIGHEDGLLRHKGAVYVPDERSIRTEIIHVHHDEELAGHFGVRKTRELIGRKYY
jgi:hypothetical protein